MPWPTALQLVSTRNNSLYNMYTSMNVTEKHGSSQCIHDIHEYILCETVHQFDFFTDAMHHLGKLSSLGVTSKQITSRDHIWVSTS